jgi:hypothetical protein
MTFPNAPSALQATTVSPYEIDETWTDNNVATGSTQFLLFRQQGAETPAPLLIPAGDTSGNDVGLSPNTLYTYQLYAINAGGWSAPSNSWSATTLPLAPTNLAVKALNARTVSVSWTDTNSDTGSTQFLLFRQQGGLTPVPLVIPAGTSSVRDTGLSPNTIYTYQVFAINAGGQSAGSNLMSTTMPNG